MFRSQLRWACHLWLAVIAFGTEAVDGEQLLVASFFSDRVGRYDAENGTYLNMLDANGLDGPLATKIGPDDLLYVTSEGSHEVQRYDWRTGAFVDNFATARSGGLNGPSGIAWDAAGDLYVGSFFTDAVLKYDGVTGQYLSTPITRQTGLNGPDNGMTFGPDGKLYVPSYYTNQVLRFDLATGQSEVFIDGIGRPRVLVYHGRCPADDRGGCGAKREPFLPTARRRAMNECC